MHAYAKECTHASQRAGTLRPVYGGSPSLPHHKCVFAIRGERGEKRGIHVGVYLSFGQIQPGAALAGSLPQTPAAPVPPATHTDTVHRQVLSLTHTQTCSS